MGGGVCTLYEGLIPCRSVGAFTQGDDKASQPSSGTPREHPMPSPGGPLLALSFHIGGARGKGRSAPPYIAVQIFGGELRASRTTLRQTQFPEEAHYTGTVQCNLSS